MRQLTFGSLFAGIGGFDLGFERAGMKCRWQVEIEPYCQKVLTKHWPDVGRWDDVRTFPPTPAEDWYVDVICGGFPCQDISNAGKRKGIEGKRSGLWTEFAKIIRILRPKYVVVENVAAILIRGFPKVLGDLAESGYDAEWSLFPMCSLGAPHSRERLFLIAHTNKIGRRCRRNRVPSPTRSDYWKATQGKSKWKDVECWIRENFQDCYGTSDSSRLQRMVDGVSNRVDRVGVCGNSVCPQIAEWIGKKIIRYEKTKTEINL